MENREELLSKGTIGFEYDDYSSLSLFLILVIFALNLTSIIMQNNFKLVYIFNNNYKERLTIFEYLPENQSHR